MEQDIITLVAEDGASLSSGNLRLYAMSTPHPPSRGGETTTPASASPLEGGRGGQAPVVVGSIDLYAYDPLNRHAAVGIMVANEYRRQGYGLAMLHGLASMAEQTFNIHMLYADIAAPNTASLALFRKAGYTQCGHFKEWLEYDSHFIDNIRMQLLL